MIIFIDDLTRDLLYHLFGLWNPLRDSCIRMACVTLTNHICHDLLTCLQRLTGNLNLLIRSYHLDRILKDTWLGFTLMILYLGRSN